MNFSQIDLDQTHIRLTTDLANHDLKRYIFSIRKDLENYILKNEYFLVSGSGKFFGNIKSATEENICIVEVDDTGKNYRIVWGLVAGGRPTSELPAHLMNHSVKLTATNGEHGK